MLKVRKFKKCVKEASDLEKFISGDSSWRMLNGEAGFVSIGFVFFELEGKNWEHNI